MKNILKKSLILVLFGLWLMPCTAGAGQSIYEEVNISFPGAPSYVQNQNDAYFTVEIKVLGTENVKYKIAYSTDDFKTETDEEFEVKPGRYTQKRIDLSNMPKGAYDMSVKVTEGERLVAEKKLGIGIIEFYEPTPLDMFSRIGITVGMTQKGGYEIRQLASEQAALLRRCGIFNVRYSGAGTWVSVEKMPGVYNFLGTNIYRDYYEDMNNVQFVGGSNGISLYKDEKGQQAPRTMAQLDALMNFQRAKLDRYPAENAYRTLFSVWNEPNLQYYWPSEPSAYEYSVMQKLISLEVKKRYPDMPVIALDIANGTNAVEYIRQMLDTDAYPYIEGYSIHPYSFPRDIDQTYEPLVLKFLGISEDYGGFLDVYVTETGYPTPNSTQGVSEQTQAENIVKALVYDDKYDIKRTYFYNFKDNGPDENDRESNFGILDYDWSPKPAYAAMSQATKMLNSSEYVGQMNTIEGISAYVYLDSDNNKPFIIMWATRDDVLYNAEDDMYIEDLYGNEIKDKSFMLTGSPIYINNIDPEFLYGTISKTVADKAAKLVGKYEQAAGVSGFEAITDKATVRNKLADPEMFADELFATGKRLIEDYDGEVYTQEQLGAMLSDIFDINKFVVLALEERSFSLSSVNAVNSMGKLLSEKKNGNDSSLKLTDKMYNRAKNYSLWLTDSYDGKNAVLRGKDLLAVGLCGWADKMRGIEKVNSNVKLVTAAYPSYIDSFQNMTEAIQYTIINDRKKNVDGYVVITDDDGNEVSDRYPVNTKSGTREELELELRLSADKPVGEYKYRISLIEDGVESAFLHLPVKVKTLLDVKLKSLGVPVDELEDVELVVDCLYDGKTESTFKITPPEGWSIKNDTFDITFDSSGEQVIKLEVDKKTRSRFNEYVFGVRAEKPNGDVIVERKLVADFDLILYSAEDIEPSDFDGDITAWENAYPVHVSPPSEPQAAEAWEESNISARAFLKWSPSYLYVLMDIYDDYHSNMFSGNGAWNGDCIQISIDTLCDKSDSYQSDDYEIGFSYAFAGNDIWEYYNSENKQKALDPGYMKVIRDNRYNITRYYIRLPQSEIKPANLEQNSKIGFNYGINDGDMTERERFIEYTLGTCTKKSPAMYKDFKFIGSDETPYETDLGTYRVAIQNDFDN